MMDMEQLAAFIRNDMPAHYQDICNSLKSLMDELNYTKAELSNMLLSTQNRNNFSRAHEILDAQEALVKMISEIDLFLNEIGINNIDKIHDVEKDNNVLRQEEVQKQSTGSEERVDYSLFETDDTVAYSITDTPVTFKRPSAFSLNERKYTVTTWKSMLAKVCGLLYKMDASILSDMVGEKRRSGQRRVRMSLRESELHSPMLIPGSKIWVETNRSATDICKSILVLLERYSISPDNMKVFFRRDYTALHNEEHSIDNTE